MSNIQTTWATGGMIKSSSMTHITHNSHYVFDVPFLERMSRKPEFCGKRRGGPRSQVFCEIFKEVPHTTHIGKSRMGIWYRWENQ